jgi:hypothetical protein
VHGGAGPAEDLRGGLGVHFGSGSAAQLEIDDDGGTTLLAALTKVGGRVSGPGECQIGLSQVGPSRAKLLDLRGVTSGPGADAVRQAREPALLRGQMPHPGPRRAPVGDAVDPDVGSLQKCSASFTGGAFRLRAVTTDRPAGVHAAICPVGASALNVVGG